MWNFWPFNFFRKRREKRLKMLAEIEDYRQKVSQHEQFIARQDHTRAIVGDDYRRKHKKKLHQPEYMPPAQSTRREETTDDIDILKTGLALASMNDSVFGSSSSSDDNKSWSGGGGDFSGGGASSSWDSGSSSDSGSSDSGSSGGSDY